MERFKRWVRGLRSEKGPSTGEGAGAPPVRREPETAATAPVYERHSHGLEQFFAQIQQEAGVRLLDLGGVTQANVAFITGLGHKLYAEDFPRELARLAAGGVAGHGEEIDPAVVRDFLDRNLGFPEGCFDGVLLWDTLEFMPPPLLEATVARLRSIMKAGAYLLAFFHAAERPAEVPVYCYRIADASTLHLAQLAARRPEQLFNNRAIERLFEEFESVKFFLARDHLREVIVRR